MAKSVNKAELAEILGISERSLTEWQDQGMPLVYKGDRGESNEYDTAQVIAWWIQREVFKVQGEKPEDRLRRVQADRVELEIKEKTGQLIPVSEIRPTWERMVLAARAKILAIPRSSAHLLETAPGVEGKRALLAELLDAALRELSNYEPGDFGYSGSESPVGAAEADDGSGVGGEQAAAA